jgi:flagellar basal-body rod protein FlgB
MKIFNTSYSEFLKRSLDMHTSQNEAISKNIENANTIDFIRKDTDFSELLPEVQQNNKITTTNKNHLTKLHYNSSWENNNEEKGVDLTQEMSEMAINQINHDFNVRAMRRMYDGIRAAIKGHSR